MATINLLPWREKQREVKNREFTLQLIVATMLALFLAFLAWTFFNMQLESQNQANELVKGKNVELDQKLKKIEELEKTRENIISRMKIIQDLQGKRPVQVHVFDSLVRTMPKNLYYSSITRQGNTLILKGKADNPNTVSDLLRNFEKSNWIGSASVKKIANGRQSPNGDSSIAPEANYISFDISAEIVEKEIVEDVGSEKSQPDTSNVQTEGNETSGQQG